MENVASDTGCHNIGVIRLAGGHKGLDLFDPSLNKYISIKTEAFDNPAFEFGTKAPLRIGIMVNDGHFMTLI
jgi:hypothetical protein